MIGLLVRLIWRLMPVMIILFALRQGTEGGQKAFIKIKNMALQVQVYIELQGVQRVLSLDLMSGGELPWDLGEYMASHLGNKSGTGVNGNDPWGSPYQIDDLGHALMLYSCGADESCGSDDDITLTMPRP